MLVSFILFAFVFVLVMSSLSFVYFSKALYATSYNMIVFSILLLLLVDDDDVVAVDLSFVLLIARRWNTNARLKMVIRDNKDNPMLCP